MVRSRWAPPPMEGKGPREGQRMAIGQWAPPAADKIITPWRHAKIPPLQTPRLIHLRPCPWGPRHCPPDRLRTGVRGHEIDDGRRPPAQHPQCHRQRGAGGTSAGIGPRAAGRTGEVLRDVPGGRRGGGVVHAGPEAADAAQHVGGEPRCVRRPTAVGERTPAVEGHSVGPHAPPPTPGLL